MTKHQKLTAFFETDTPFKEPLNRLRSVLLETELEEDWKWNFPTYTYGGKNLIALGRFKEHFGIWFFQGVFLKDRLGLLRNAQEGKTKAMRALNYARKEALDIDIVKAYVDEAIANSSAGKEVKPDRSPKKVAIPDELVHAFAKSDILENAFKKLTPGKQREYCEHIGGAKQETTRLRRLEKCRPMMIKGIGLNDKYKN
ncbi:MAG: hypothetical protein CL867_00415 [Cytophagaceae bacterium]|nr:hypothetical protein [Cytophagaceae bacterium]